MIRDRMCRFPGCSQTRHLKAHHRISWADGGPTNLDNLILLCQWHHTTVHEGGITIHPKDTDPQQWEFRMPDGTPHQPWYHPDTVPDLLCHQLDTQRQERNAALAAITSLDHPTAHTIRPGWTGEPLDLHACIQALFGMRLEAEEEEKQAAA